MKGTPDNTVILHWDECQTAWTELPWRDWVRFEDLVEEVPVEPDGIFGIDRPFRDVFIRAKFQAHQTGSF
jgi:hypothetical protein